VKFSLSRTTPLPQGSRISSSSKKKAFKSSSRIKVAYFTPSWTVISRQAGQVFHAKVDTDFTASWTAISHEAGQQRPDVATRVNRGTLDDFVERPHGISNVDHA
jgi:hypothetical protein